MLDRATIGSDKGASLANRISMERAAGQCGANQRRNVMAFHRFEDFKVHHLNPHLSSGEGPVIEGAYMYFRLVTKRAGTGSALHYHPNELMTFPLAGKINAVVGRERRIVQPGTFVHIPPFARHGFTATEDGDLHYLYIKDRTWTLIGSAQDEALPHEAPSATQVAKKFKAGKYPGRKKEPQKSSAILDGLGNCFYTMIESLKAPTASGRNDQWVEGTNLAFGFIDTPADHGDKADCAPHELFMYVISGAVQARVGRERKRLGAGGVMQIPKGSAYEWNALKAARLAGVRSTPRLEAYIDAHGAADNWRG
jgi:quercetin dioxygenase-like cupin family protein